MKKLLPNYKVDFSDIELDEINLQVTKMDIFFSKDEFSLLKKYALNEVVGILKQISEVKFTKDGTLGVDTIYQFATLFGERIQRKRIKNPWPLFAILEKLITVLLYKLDETDELLINEKHEILNSVFGSVNKSLVIENITLEQVFPRFAALGKELQKKYSPSQLDITKKKRKSVSAKINALLQKEINSKCPFCSNEDVDHFETHHIDENPENNDIQNLIRLCAICHSKITKGDITKDQVILIKKGLAVRGKIEIYTINVDKTKCAWEASPDVPYAFHLIPDDNRSSFPILQFGLINHYDKTIVLKNIELRTKSLSMGISGIPDSVPGPVAKMNVKNIMLKGDEEIHLVENFEAIEIPAGKSVIYQIELSQAEISSQEFSVLYSRKVLYFVFKFSNDIALELPKIFLNTEDEEEGTTLIYMH